MRMSVVENLVLMLENELVLNLLFNATNVDSAVTPVEIGRHGITGWHSLPKGSH